jgi:hypothetical protein
LALFGAQFNTYTSLHIGPFRDPSLVVPTNHRSAYSDQSQMTHQRSRPNKRGCTDLSNQSPLTW